MLLSRRQRGLFDEAAGPSPWHLRGRDAPTVAGFIWSEAGETAELSGKSILTGPQGPVVVLSFYNWVMNLDPDTLLIWHQPATPSDASTAPVNFSIFRPADIAPFTRPVEPICAELTSDGPPAAFGSQPAVRFELDTTEVGIPRSAVFPGVLHGLEELLLWCHSSGVARREAPGVGDTALVVARPGRSTYRLYPQDWFNYGGVDLGYQWVTRVARDKRTGRIHGDGIRVSPFALDNSLTQLA